MAVARAEVSNYEIVNHWFDLAADRIGLRDDIREVLRSSYREVQVQIPVTLGDGKIHVFNGFRVQHNGARGPYKGGDPLPPGGRPRRGARARDADDAGRPRSPTSRSAAPRAGSTCDAAERSTRPSSSRSRARFIDKIEKVLGPQRDIPAPDVGTNAQTMAWMMDEYGKLHGHTPAIVTGKPISLEGSYGREAATGRGIVHMFREAAPGSASQPADCRVVRPGLRQRRLVGGADHRPARRAPDRRRLGRPRRRPRRGRARPRGARSAHVREGGRLAEFEGGEAIDAEELLATRVRGASSPPRSAA